MLLIFLYGFFAFVSLALGIRQTYFRKNPYGLTPQLIIYGIFVWGDAIIIGLFWTVVSLITVLTGNTSFFLITQAVYWIVRSMGEIIYWFLQQFAETKRDLPKTLAFHQFFPGESIWFAYQLFWQIVLVISIISLIYLINSVFL